MEQKKKTYTVIGAAVLAGALLVTPVTSMAQQIYNKLTIKQVVDIMKENDLQSQIILEDEELDNWRIAFLPRDGYVPPHNPNASSWTAAYRLNVEPLRTQANQDREDYQKLSGDLQREASSYGQVFNYWILKKQLEVSNNNLALVKDEHKNTKIRFDNGVASKHDLLQVEISLNNAQVSYDEAVTNFDKLQYAVNQKLDQDIPQDIEITITDFSFLPDAELDKAALKKQIFEQHPSLDATKKELQAFRKGYEVVTADDFKPGNDTLPIYLEREVKYWDLNLRQQQQQLEMSMYSLVDDLVQLKKAVTLYEENVKQGEQVYEMAVKQFEQGVTTYTDVDQARMNLLNTNMQLGAAQKDYMEKKENFRLLKAGHIPQ